MNLKNIKIKINKKINKDWSWLDLKSKYNKIIKIKIKYVTIN